jgi:hypothetical protein
VLPRAAGSILVFGWLSVLTGLTLVTIGAIMVDHATVIGRLLPVFLTGPLWTLAQALRYRTNAVAVSAASAVGLLVGGAIDLVRDHPVAGRYELALAVAAGLVSIAAQLANDPAAKTEQNLPTT